MGPSPMAHFSDHGKHCSHPYCHQKDFLPFKCDLCDAVLCREHLRYEDHDCPNKARKDVRVLVCPCCDKPVRINPDEDSDLTLAKHMESEECAIAQRVKEEQAKPPRCPVDGCKAKLTSSGSVTCGTCQQRVCLKHRFEDAHVCRKPSGYCKPCGQQSLASALAGLLGRTRF